MDKNDTQYNAYGQRIEKQPKKVEHVDWDGEEIELEDEVFVTGIGYLLVENLNSEAFEFCKEYFGDPIKLEEDLD